MVLDFDADRLMRFLRSDLAYEDPIAYVETRISPCLSIIGSAWSEGALDVAHEHFASERISDVLREVRLRFEETATGPSVVLATLPGEAHGLGLQITALVLASRGVRVLGLGTEVPIADIAALAERTGAVAVGISVSAASEGKARAPLARLRTRLPRRVQMIIGGAGAPASLKGARVLGDLRELKSWADELRQA
jgi:methanogenic corrinoid protein MtbC1